MAQRLQPKICLDSLIQSRLLQRLKQQLEPVLHETQTLIHSCASWLNQKFAHCGPCPLHATRFPGAPAGTGGGSQGRGWSTAEFTKKRLVFRNNASGDDEGASSFFASPGNANCLENHASSQVWRKLLRRTCERGSLRLCSEGSGAVEMFGCEGAFGNIWNGSLLQALDTQSLRHGWFARDCGLNQATLWHLTEN